MLETQILGPPGTGKTTELIRHIKGWLRDNSSESLAVYSLTRAAVATLRDRCDSQHLRIRDKSINTLHSFCVGKAFAARYKLFDATHLDAWNDSVADGNPLLQLSEKALMPSGVQELLEELDDSDDEIEQTRSLSGDESYGLMQAYRSVERPVNTWPADVQAFYELYEKFKSKRRLVDFTDTVKMVDEQQTGPPRGVGLLLVDEAADHDKTEMRIFRRWLPKLERLTFFGDPHQAIFVFRGAAPQEMTSVNVPRKTLPISYRCPEEIWNCAQRWLSQHQPYAPLPTKPRGPGGLVMTREASLVYQEWKPGYKDCMSLLEYLHAQVAAGRTALVLAATNRHVCYLISRMKKLDLPYAFPRMDSDSRPRRAVLFSTIHGAKGMEADCVAVFPDLSRSAWAQYRQLRIPYATLRKLRRPWEIDEHPAMPVIRMFYVALTRAREELYLCAPAASAGSDEQCAVDWL